MNPVLIERRGDFVVTMYELEEEACRLLLERCRFGRVGFVGDHGPEVLPVNAMFSAGSVLYRTVDGSPLDRFVTGHIVAFEVDNTDVAAESGWSVLVRGTGNRLTDPNRLAAIADTEVHPWAPGPHGRWMEIRTDHVSGRIIRRHRLGTDRHSVPYMPPD